MPSPRPLVRFDDVPAGTTLQFSHFREEITARTPQQVRAALSAVQDRVDAGAWAAGMITYEAAPGLDPALSTHAPSDLLPLLWFGIADAPDAPDAPDLPDAPAAPPSGVRGTYEVGAWQDEWSPAEYAEKVARVRAAIADGDTYQVNLTTRRRGRVTGDLLACYLDLIAAQGSAHSAYLDLGRAAILSASPELFVRREGERLTTTPMKGTAERRPGMAADAASRAHLLHSAKERAENIMIVDLLRNDLARLAVPGSVEVPALLELEQYPTLWQMTSTVTATARPGIGLEELMAAMFPCGSITGAPKASTTALIRDLESGPRGVYCGAIGWLAPARDTPAGPVPASSSFSVAIRTLVVDRSDGSAEYGVGSGVTWASAAAAEHAELEVKTRVLDALGSQQPAEATAEDHTSGSEPFALLETFAVVGGTARHLQQHLDRLESSADAFALRCDRAAVRAAVQERARALGAAGRDAIVRLTLGMTGELTLSERPLLPAGPGPVRLGIDDVLQDPDSPAVRHKTNDRAHLAEALSRVRARASEARASDVEDVVLRGREGRVTETTIATLTVEIEGTWWTPPLSDGSLAGVGRRLALEAGRLREREITAEELGAARRIALLSSVRGWRAATLRLRDAGR